MKTRLGLSLQPDRRFLEGTRRIAEEWADFFEVAPEQLWEPGPRAGDLHRLFLEIKRRSGKPFVAHGLALSPGTAGEDARFEAWLDAIRSDQEAFGFEWYSEHLGFTEAGGWNAALPLPLPMTEEAVAAVSARMRRLREIVPTVALENQATYFTLGPHEREGEFLNRICRESGCFLLLDLHNAYTQCVNFGMNLREYLAPLDLSRVIEIHLSGGSESEAGWLPSARVFRLDSHDGPVPEEVWKAFEWALPRCPNLRGVVVERIAPSLRPEDVPGFEAEFRRAMEILC